MKSFFNKLVRSKFSILYLIVFIGLLYTLQEKAIMPLVLKVVKSEVFFEKPIEENEPLGKLDKKTERTGYAFSSCRDAVKEQADIPDNAKVDDDYEVWALGNRQYLIRSGVKMKDEEKLFACTVRLTNDDQTQMANWSILGVDFNPGDD